MKPQASKLPLRGIPAGTFFVSGNTVYERGETRWAAYPLRPVRFSRSGRPLSIRLDGTTRFAVLGTDLAAAIARQDELTAAANAAEAARREAAAARGAARFALFLAAGGQAAAEAWVADKPHVTGNCCPGSITRAKKVRHAYCNWLEQTVTNHPDNQHTNSTP